MCENDSLLNQILKREWGFQGFVTSDFGATHSTVESANAGLDLEMPTGVYFGSALQSAVTSGQVAQTVISDHLIRRFSTMMRLGVFNNPPAISTMPSLQDGSIARQIAEAGMVLLQNNGAILPLNAGNLHKIAVIGPFAGVAKTGGGGSSMVTPIYTVAPVMGIQNRVGSGVTVSYNDVNPSGKLPLTFPANLSDLPANTTAQYPGVNGVATYSEGIFVGYRYYDENNITPQFPFGFGLSYTNFTFQNLAINPSTPTLSNNPGQTVTVSLSVTNTGAMAGAEVVQLYVGIPSTAVPEPPKC
jgi:Glycosyl hydrolase family 3 C-terminal domain/Glycosyl hydrolase family 3 N terminal domain